MEPDRGSDQSDPATETPEAPPRRRSKLKILLAIITALAGLCIIAYVVENIRGKWAWVAFREDLEARGEKLDYRQWIPAPIPSEKNFAHTPLLKPLFETEYDEDFGTFTPADPEKHEQAERLLQGLLDFEDLPEFIRWPDGQRVDLAAFQKIFRKEGPSPPPAKLDKRLEDMLEALGVSADDKAGPPRIWPHPAKPGKPAEDILLALGVFAEDMAELTRAAKERPLCRFDIKYEVLLSAKMPHGSVLRNAIAVYTLRALAHLAADDVEAAFSDVAMGLFLADCTSSEPMLISQQMRISAHYLVLQAAWEGLASQKWNAHQLATLEKRLAGIDLLEDFHRSQLGERDMFNGELEKIRKNADIWKFNRAIVDRSWWQPTGWFDQNQLRYNEHYMRFIRRGIDLETRTIKLSVAVEQTKFIDEMSRSHPYNQFILLAILELSSVTPLFGDGQTKADLARIACLIELHKLRNGKYPSKLSEVQSPLPLPTDPYSGKPYIYSVAPGPGERYQLYGVGWNQEDDGGRIFLHEDGGIESKKGDLAWRYSPVPTLPEIQEPEEK